MANSNRPHPSQSCSPSAGGFSVRLHQAPRPELSTVLLCPSEQSSPVCASVSPHTCRRRQLGSSPVQSVLSVIPHACRRRQQGSSPVQSAPSVSPHTCRRRQLGSSPAQSAPQLVPTPVGDVSWGAVQSSLYPRVYPQLVPTPVGDSAGEQSSPVCALS